MSESAKSGAEEILRARIAQDLRTAMKVRDAPRVTALRSLAGAIDNATAVPLDTPDGQGRQASGEVPRKELSADDVRAILRREITERRNAQFAFESHGCFEEAVALELEIAILEAYAAVID